MTIAAAETARDLFDASFLVRDGDVEECSQEYVLETIEAAILRDRRVNRFAQAQHALAAAEAWRDAFAGMVWACEPFYGTLNFQEALPLARLLLVAGSPVLAIAFMQGWAAHDPEGVQEHALALSTAFADFRAHPNYDAAQEATWARD